MALPYELTTARPKQIGLIVLQADETLERDMRVVLPDDVEFLVSRVPSATSVSRESLQAMANDLTQAASLLPVGATLSAVGYGCTSGTAQIGADQIAALIQAGLQTPKVTEPVSALIAACAHLGVTRIGLISPYVASVSDQLRLILADAGIKVTQFASFDEPTEERVVRISQDSIVDAAIAMAHAEDCEAVFLSCTNLRTLDVIDRIETQIGKPVLSSNQVLAWHLCKLLDMSPERPQFGRLFNPNRVN
jgi:maleate isomerase